MIGDVKNWLGLAFIMTDQTNVIPYHHLSMCCFIWYCIILSCYMVYVIYLLWDRSSICISILRITIFELLLLISGCMRGSLSDISKDLFCYFPHRFHFLIHSIQLRGKAISDWLTWLRFDKRVGYSVITKIVKRQMYLRLRLRMNKQNQKIAAWSGCSA